MARYIYKKLSLVDVLVLVAFVMTPAWLLFEPFILGFFLYAIPSVIAGAYAAIALAWIAFALWWVLRHLFR